MQSEAQAREALQDALDEVDVLQDEADSARKVGAGSLSFRVTYPRVLIGELRVWCCTTSQNWRPVVLPMPLTRLVSCHAWLQETKRVTKEKRELEKEIQLLRKELSKAGVTPHKVSRLSDPLSASPRSVVKSLLSLLPHAGLQGIHKP